MKTILIFALCNSLLSLNLYSQKATDSAKHAAIVANYNLAVEYKDGKGVPIDYIKAFKYFNKAAAMDDPQSIYAVAYMYYKGLGCKQNYDTAANLFEKGIALGKDNSLYFYGLCWRNGYGRPKNEDSAKFYLQKSADLGYRQALMELESKRAENSSDSAVQALLGKLHNAAIPNKYELNHFTKVQPKLPASELIQGNYEGWVIQYDWSGNHIVSVKKLSLSLNYYGSRVTGLWIEDLKDSAKINATIEGDSLLFAKTSYRRTDHYSPVQLVHYNFENAKLSLVQLSDSVFLAGKIEMFSPDRREPSKPLFVALARIEPIDSLFLKNLELKVYPNPFEETFTLQFNIVKPRSVQVTLFDINGLAVYRNYAGKLQEGQYMLPIKTSKIASGAYILKVTFDDHEASLKLLKQ